MHAWSLASLREAAVAAIFLACYFVFAAGRLPGTRIGRAAAAGIGALLMIAVGALPGAALRQAIDVPTLTLLFAMMVVVAALYRAGVFAWIAAAVQQDPGARLGHAKNISPAPAPFREARAPPGESRRRAAVG